MTAIDPILAAKCKAMGMTTLGDFGRRTGRRITDLSTAKAMALLDGITEEPTDNFPDRWKNDRDLPIPTKDEIGAMQQAGYRAYLQERDKHADTQGTAGATRHPYHADDSDHAHRPVFGQPLPGRRSGSPARRRVVHSD